MKKKSIVLLLAVILLLGSFFIFLLKVDSKNTSIQANSGTDDQDAVVEFLLFPEIGKDVERFYKPYFNFPPNIDLVSMDILDINRVPSGYDVTLQIFPYLGAHNSIGKDIVTMNITTNSIATKEFKHVESYDVPD